MSEAGEGDMGEIAYREVFMCWASPPGEDYPFDHDDHSGKDCDWGWVCNQPDCDIRVDDLPCAKHAPIAFPGLRLVECTADPRHYLFAHDREDYGHACFWCAYKKEHAKVAELEAKLAEAEMHWAADRKRANEAARLSAAARDEAEDLRGQIGELQEHIGIVEGDRLELQEQRGFVLTLCDDADQVVGRAGFLRVDAIREALDAPTGTSTLSLRFEATSAEWSLRERDIIEAAKAWRIAGPDDYIKLHSATEALYDAVDALAAADSSSKAPAADTGETGPGVDVPPAIWLIAHGYTGHGHRCCKKAPTERPPGYRAVAKCGGPGLCEQCADDRDELHAAPTGPISHVVPTNPQTWERAALPPPVSCPACGAPAHVWCFEAALGGHTIGRVHSQRRERADSRAGQTGEEVTG